jgi:hypothetical protein
MEGSSAEDLAASAAVVLGRPWPPRTQDILSKLELWPALCGYDADEGLSTASNFCFTSYETMLVFGLRFSPYYYIHTRESLSVHLLHHAAEHEQQ